MRSNPDLALTPPGYDLLRLSGLGTIARRKAQQIRDEHAATSTPTFHRARLALPAQRNR